MTGRTRLICRLVWRDMRQRRAEAAMLLLAIMAATTTLSLGLLLYGVTGHPYQQTRAATAGPDIVASYLDLPPMPRNATEAAGLAALRTLDHVHGVTGHAGPYPVSWPLLRAHGLRVGVMAEGRNLAAAPIDQPKLTQGHWVRAGQVVIERGFADALGLTAGDRITLNGRSFTVAGIAVTAANVPFPGASFAMSGTPFGQTGMIWLTQPAARSFATRALPISFIENLTLARPASAQAFQLAHGTNSVLALSAWQDISHQDSNLVLNVQRALLVGSWLLGLLAIASVAVLVGGRMAEQTRRVGLLKAVGGTPRLVAAVLLAEHVALAVTAAAAGLAVGWLAAPLLGRPSTGLVGTAGAPALSVSTAGWVMALALAVAVLATLVPAIRAARISTVRALADAARAPRRGRLVIAISRRLPVPLLLGLRLAGRRPRRMVLSTVSIMITVCTIVAVLAVHAHQAGQDFGALSTLAEPRHQRVDQVLLIITVLLAALAAVNAIFISWATVVDNRRASALTRALGLTPQQVGAGMSAAQLLAALPGALLGIPAGILLVGAVSHGGTYTVPSAWLLAATVAGTLLVIVVLSTITARIGALRPVAETLQSET